MHSLAPNLHSMHSPSTCADECQNTILPSLSSNFLSSSVQSPSSGRTRSHSSALAAAAAAALPPPPPAPPPPPSAAGISSSMPSELSAPTPSASSRPTRLL